MKDIEWARNAIFAGVAESRTPCVASVTAPAETRTLCRCNQRRDVDVRRARNRDEGVAKSTTESTQRRRETERVQSPARRVRAAYRRLAGCRGQLTNGGARAQLVSGDEVRQLNERVIALSKQKTALIVRSISDRHGTGLRVTMRPPRWAGGITREGCSVVSICFKNVSTRTTLDHRSTY